MVPVLDRRGRPLDPCSGKRARLLLARGRAVVVGHAPFTIRLRDRTVDASVVHPLACKIDPGSRTDGAALVRREEGSDVLVACAHVVHKGSVSSVLGQRSRYRKRRRSVLWHRKKRFSNRSPAPCASCGCNAVHGRSRCRPCAESRSQRVAGVRPRRLPPSLRARVDEALHAVEKQTRIYPIGAISVEAARFDTHLLRNPDISGSGYQKGLLYESNLREYGSPATGTDAGTAMPLARCSTSATSSRALVGVRPGPTTSWRAASPATKQKTTAMPPSSATPRCRQESTYRSGTPPT